MEFVLSMVFLTERGAKSTLSIAGVKSTLTEAQANALMDTIIAKNIFLRNSSLITSAINVLTVSEIWCDELRLQLVTL